MKNLYFVRHAKSNREEKNIPDFERPLNDRGKKDAPFMAGILQKKNVKVDLIISSPANRALTTAKVFANELGISEKEILTDEKIYEATMKRLLKVLQSIDDSKDNVMIFGHNPGLTYLSNYICDYETDNIPTCGIICMQPDFDSWKYLGSKSCSFKFFEYPKKYL